MAKIIIEVYKYRKKIDKKVDSNILSYTMMYQIPYIVHKNKWRTQIKFQVSRVCYNSWNDLISFSN